MGTIYEAEAAAGGNWTIFRGPNVWLRITGSVNGGGSISPVFIQSGFEQPTELYVYADGKAAYHASPYMNTPNFVANISARNILVTTDPMPVSAPTAPSESPRDSRRRRTRRYRATISYFQQQQRLQWGPCWLPLD
jgi:hypothetical protein